MSNKRNNDLLNMRVTVSGAEDLNAICFAIRGLFASIGNSDGQYKSNQQFRRGVVIEF